MLAESLPNSPVLLSLDLLPVRNALLPHVAQASACEVAQASACELHPLKSVPHIHNFGIMLEPRWIVGTESLDQ